LAAGKQGFQSFGAAPEHEIVKVVDVDQAGNLEPHVASPSFLLSRSDPRLPRHSRRRHSTAMAGPRLISNSPDFDG